MMARGRMAMTEAEWNNTWAEYDARQPVPVRPAAPCLPTRPLVASPVPSPSRSGLGAFRAIIALLPLLAAGWVGAPYATAWNLAQAMEGGDAAQLSRHFDMPAIQTAMRETLAPATAPEGEEATAFLGAMADDIAAAWSNPAALQEVSRARGLPPGAPAAAFRRALPTGLTRFEMPLSGGASPVTLQLEFRPDGMAPRWQVTGVRMDATAPAVSPGPALRLSAMR